jgi:peptidoglycan hydrolase-like protein with peptidoglycan-binding domain
VTSPVALQVLKNLAAGSRGTDVRNLQEMLKSDSSLYPEGMVNGNFGPATLRAVRKFQQKYGITPVNGRVGPLTRAKLQEVFGAAVPAPTPSVPARSASQTSPTSVTGGGSALIFVKDLALGNRNDDVRRLQELLSTIKEIYPEGTVNGNFGPATQRAIRRFQAKYRITQNGRVGPLTRAKLRDVFEIIRQAPAALSVPAPTLTPPAPVPPTPAATTTPSMTATSSAATTLTASSTVLVSTSTSVTVGATATSTATSTSSQ